MQSVSIVMPCCNEGEAVELLPVRLFAVIEQLVERNVVELILVDDGSTDDTWARLIALAKGDTPCPVILRRHSVQQGLGSALQTGCRLAAGDIIVVIEADGSYPFQVIETLLAAVRDGADVASASPYHPAGGVEGPPTMRLFFSRGAALCYRAVVDRRIATYTAVARAYQAPTLFAALEDDAGPLHVVKALVEARRHGARVAEVPAVLARRPARRAGSRPMRLVGAHLAYLSRLAWLRGTGRFWVAPGVLDRTGQAKVTEHG